MSLAQTIYYAIPVPAQSVLVSAYGCYLKRKRHGGAARRVRLLIEAARTWNADEVERYQSTQLSHIMSTCARSVPHYREQWKGLGIDAAALTSVARLATLPILPKEVVRSKGALLRREGAGAFWTQHTSGSTGTPVVVHVNRLTYQLTHALLEEHERTCGVAPSDLRATFAGRMVQPPEDISPPFWRYNWPLRQVLFSAYHLSPTTLPLYVDELARRQPAELIGYPSAIATVATHINCTRQQGRVRPRVVVSNSETLFPWQRQVIEEAFGCPVRDYYGSAESLVFAAQCVAGAYHFHPLLGVAEVVDRDGSPVPPGGSGRLVCTTFTNDVMPLVRYEIGDSAARLDGPCSCGSVFDGVREILGRQDDVIVTADGREIGRMDHIFKGASGIQEGQIIQDELGGIRIHLVAGLEFDQRQERMLIENARARLGDAMRVEVLRVPAIARTRAGKFRAVVNLLPAEARPGHRRTYQD